jgi:adenylate cyclase
MSFYCLQKYSMGLNFGESIAGNIGSEQRMEYTIIGDTVNVATRLESMTKELKTDFLISESVQNLLNDKFDFEEGGSLDLKGREIKITAYKVIGRKEKPTEIYFFL